MTATVLPEDVQALENSLHTSGDRVHVTLSRQAAEFMAQIARAKVQGQEVVLTKGLDEVIEHMMANLPAFDQAAADHSGK